MRAGRDSPLRADAIGIDVKRMQWAAFVDRRRCSPGWPARCTRSRRAASRPTAISVGRSVDGLVMVLLGGLQTLAGPIVGAVTFTWLQDSVARNTDYWRALLGARSSCCWCSLFPQGIVGFVRERFGDDSADQAATSAAVACPQARRDQGGPMSLLQRLGSRQVVRRRQGGRRRRVRSRSRRIARADRPERRRQVDLASTWSTASCAPTPARSVSTATSWSACAARHLAARRRPHVPDRRDLRLDDRGRERADGAAVAPTRSCSRCGSRAAAH